MAKSKNKNARGIALGSLVKDFITGFTGIAVGRTEFAFGCVHIRVQAKGLTSTGEPIPEQSFDDQRIEVLEPPSKSWPAPETSSIELGNLVRDSLSGAVGFVSARTIGLDGKIKFLVEQTGLSSNGDPKPAIYAQAQCLTLVEKRELKVSKDSVATSGGPMARPSPAVGFL